MASSPERDTQIEKAADFVIADSVAQRRGAIRLTAARGSIRDAFESLDLGWTYDDVERYLLGAPSFQAMVLRLGGDQRGMLQGLIMGFALVAVEQSRGAGVVPKADLEGFDMGFRACLDQLEITGLQPTSESTVKEFIRAARRRLGLS